MFGFSSLDTKLRLDEDEKMARALQESFNTTSFPSPIPDGSVSNISFPENLSFLPPPGLRYSNSIHFPSAFVVYGYIKAIINSLYLAGVAVDVTGRSPMDAFSLPCRDFGTQNVSFAMLANNLYLTLSSRLLETIPIINHASRTDIIQNVMFVYNL